MRQLKTIALFVKKLRFVDYLIIVILVLAVVLFYKFVHREQVWVNATALSYSNIFQTSSIHPGDYETDSSGKVIATVEGLESVNTPPLNGNQFYNKILILKVKMLVDKSSRSKQIQFKNHPLGVGSQVQLNLNTSTSQYYISDIEGIGTPKKFEEKTLTVIIYNQWPWFGDSINVGDIAVDANGRKVVEVISKDIKPTQVVNTTATGEVMELIGSSKVDITLKLKTQLQKVNEGYIFLGYNNVLIGRAISFALGNVQLSNAVVTNIE
jgi:hypothetical protein